MSTTDSENKRRQEEFDAEKRFRIRAARGSVEEGLRLLDLADEREEARSQSSPA